MHKILIFTNYFLPGFKAGGPVRSIKNILDILGEEYLFFVITRDRDKEDEHAYYGIKTNKWLKKDNYMINYLSPDNCTIISLYRIIVSNNFDLIYLNSFFSQLSIKILLLRRFGFLSGTPVVLAPRGEFSSGALKLKNFKKRIYILLSKIFGLYNGIIFQASSEYEKTDIADYFKEKIIIAPNLPTCHEPANSIERPFKKTGFASFVFLSRISRKKNLHKALFLLSQITEGQIVFDIYGPIDDKKYFKECETLVNALPQNIICQYKGSVQHEHVQETLLKYHFLLFPTLGENYGHVIMEAMSSGCPVIISDQTPWQGLEKLEVGWDLSLEDDTTLINVIASCVQMDNNIFLKMSNNAINYWNKVMQSSETVKQNRYLFNYALTKKEH